MINPLLWTETETIGTDNSSGMNDAILPDNAVFVNLRSGVDNSIVAYLYIVADIGLRVNLNVVAYLAVFSEVSKRTYVNIISRFCRFGNVARTLDTFPGRVYNIVYHPEQKGKRGVSVGNLDQSRRNLFFRKKIIVYQYNIRLCFVYVGGVFRVGKKGEGVGSAFFDFREAVHLNIGIADDFTIQKRSNLLRCKSHYGSFCFYLQNKE